MLFGGTSHIQTIEDNIESESIEPTHNFIFNKYHVINSEIWWCLAHGKKRHDSRFNHVFYFNSSRDDDGNVWINGNQSTFTEQQFTEVCMTSLYRIKKMFVHYNYEDKPNILILHKHLLYAVSHLPKASSCWETTRHSHVIHSWTGQRTYAIHLCQQVGKDTTLFSQTE